MRSFGHHTDAALTEPTIITRNGRDRLVIVSVDTYRELLALAVKDEISTGEALRKRLLDQLEAVL